MNQARARAHTNIALIKYWGKQDKALFLPMNSSLSLTLDAFYTDTKVTLLAAGEKDAFFLNGQAQSCQEIEKVGAFLDLFRQASGNNLPARVESLNFVPTAAGLASSASAYAALAAAANLAYETDLTDRQLSTFARRGSGSASRSIFGGFVQWNKADTSEDSYAQAIDPADWDLAMVMVVVNQASKKISSRQGMDHTVATSPFYPAWVATAQEDLIAIRQAIQAHDFQRLGEITEANAMKMHATTLSANPPFTYFEPMSLVAQDLVRQLRDKGLPAYFTMDAGPNVKVLCRASQVDQVKSFMSQAFDPQQLITALPGPGWRQLDESHWQASLQSFHLRNAL